MLTHWQLQAHQTLASAIEAQLGGVALQPAQVLAWCQTHGVSPEHAVDMLRLPALLADANNPPTLLALRALATRHEQQLQARDATAPTGSALMQPATRPTAPLTYRHLAQIANNGGVLRQAELEMILAEPDPGLRRELAQQAFTTFEGLMLHDWAAVISMPEKPEYLAFAQFLATPDGASLFEGIDNRRGGSATPDDRIYKARVLDFIGQVDKQLQLSERQPQVTREVLLEGKAEVQQQIVLTEERGVRSHNVSDPQIGVQALKLLNSQLRRIDRALSGQP